MRKEWVTALILLGIFIACIILAGCTRKAVRWINAHPKPIRSYSQQFEWRRLPDLTLIDSEGQVKYAGKTKLTLPDTIR